MFGRPASCPSLSPNGSILTLNAGSSSLKFAIFTIGTEASVSVRGEIETLDEGAHLVARDSSGSLLVDRRWQVSMTGNGTAILNALLDFAYEHVGSDGLAAVGHRIVHGGEDHVGPALVTPTLLTTLEALIPLDPLHMPLNLAPIRAIADAHPRLAQVVSFDTAFHRTMPVEARSFALPRDLRAAGVRRYGFHGLSFEYIAEQLTTLYPRLARKRVIIAHLGAGASLCALRDGVSVATTMGFSALDGLVMASRCGSLDPGVVLYLGQQGYSFDDIRELLYRRSGMLGVSGISGDIRVLAASQDPHAREAIDLFVYRLVGEIGTMTAALEGLDGLVFTAGIGEHAPAIRAAVCGRLGWLNVTLDGAANESNAMRIGGSDSAVDVLVIPTDEETVIARHTLQVMRST